MRHPQARFIPAGAGNSRSDSGMRPVPSVHPRWRGEQWWADSPRMYHAGSSPLARGTGHAIAHRQADHRFIPAGAGNSGYRPARCYWVAVHPRWRGEQCFTGTAAHAVIGSSPLARGTGGSPRGISKLARFIPAGAGNSLVTRSILTGAAVHPRWRGEQGLYRPERRG